MDSMGQKTKIFINCLPQVLVQISPKIKRQIDEKDQSLKPNKNFQDFKQFAEPLHLLQSFEDDESYKDWNIKTRKICFSSDKSVNSSKRMNSTNTANNI